MKPSAFFVFFGRCAVGSHAADHPRNRATIYSTVIYLRPDRRDYGCVLVQYKVIRLSFCCAGIALGGLPAR